MSDTSPARTPSSVERMSSTTPKNGGGFGGMLTILLVLACILLIGACFYISSGKREVQTKLDEVTTKLNDANSATADATNKLTAANRDVATFRGMVERSIPLSRLPAAVQAPTANEALAKIQQMADGPKMAENTKSGAPNMTPPTNDSPAAWMETIAKQVAKTSINTKEPAGNDAAKVQMHKGIQIVLARVGAFSKPTTGNSQDTFEAVVAFQKANKLAADGIIGKGTWSKVREKLEATAHAGQ